ncbi:MAG: deoxyribodipyrimidine photo-lyase, partial [Draconibacterium sp.]
MKEKINIFWFRRDLRLNDNVGLFHALEASLPVLPIFIFDKKILGKLSLKTDARVTFIYHQLEKIKQELEKAGRSLKVLHSTPLEAFQGLWTEYEIKTVFTNRDYEPDALERDTEMENFLKSKNIGFLTFKDHVIFEKNEIVKDNGEPYTVFTPYSKKWKLLLADKTIPQFKSEKLLSKVLQNKPFPMPTLENIGFEESRISIPMS